MRCHDLKVLGRGSGKALAVLTSDLQPKDRSPCSEPVASI